MNLEIKPYKENDLALYSTRNYYTAGTTAASSQFGPFVPSDSNALAVYRYNASILSNSATEENHPCI